MSILETISTRALDGKNSPELAQAAGIREDYRLQCAIIIGYTADEKEFSLGERQPRGNVNWID